jgi:hypothetical protein
VRSSLDWELPCGNEFTSRGVRRSDEPPFALNRSPQGFTALVLLVTLVSGILLFFLGVIGEYVGRLYEEVKARPHYVVWKTVGRPSARSRQASRPGDATKVVVEPRDAPAIAGKAEE